MKKTKFLIPLFLSVFFGWLASGLMAQENSSDSQITPTVNPEVKEKVEERIEKVLKANTQKKRAFNGEILSIDDSLSVDTRHGERTVKITSETDIVGPKKEALELEDLSEGDYVITMGYLEDEDTLEARRIAVSQKPTPKEIDIALGEVTDSSSDGENILTIKRANTETIYEVEVTAKTVITKKSDGEMAKAKFSDVEIGDRVIALGKMDADNNFTATRLHVIPGQAEGMAAEEEEETTTPSPEPTTTPEE
jgi:hypothetical protein